MNRISQNLLALLIGLVIGALGTVVHNFALGWFPLGLLVALLGSASATRIIGVRFARRGVRFWFLLGWSAIVFRAATFGNSDELLIMSNNAGNAYLALGFALVLGNIWARI